MNPIMIKKTMAIPGRLCCSRFEIGKRAGITILAHSRPKTAKMPPSERKEGVKNFLLGSKSLEFEYPNDGGGD